MATQHRYSIEFKRQVVQEYQAGESPHGLAKRHGIDPAHVHESFKSRADFRTLEMFALAVICPRKSRTLDCQHSPSPLGRRKLSSGTRESRS
jgi:hypothetical protein